MIGTCEDCRFWDGPGKNARASAGPRQQCRRRGPVIVVAPNPYGGPDKPAAMWPFTAKEDWCGDYVPDASAQVKAVAHG